MPATGGIEAPRRRDIKLARALGLPWPASVSCHHQQLPGTVSKSDINSHKCMQAMAIINDRVDVALASGADGVHVGQSDLPAAAARRLLGSHRVLGVSVKTIAQAQAAQAAGADYLGAGAGDSCLRFLSNSSDPCYRSVK